MQKKAPDEEAILVQNQGQVHPSVWDCPWLSLNILIIFLIRISLFDFRSSKKIGKTRKRGEFLFPIDP